MEKLSDVVAFLNKKLDVTAFKDVSFNGLQIEGRDSVNRILFAVDSGLQTFERAAERSADMIVVHHGLFWKYANPSILGVMKKRISLLFENSISLYAAHLPLDMQPNFGNNISLIKAAGAEIIYEQPKNFYGLIGFFNSAPTLSSVVDRTVAECNCKHPKLLEFSSDRVSKIAVLSGSSSYSDIEIAISYGVQLFITGEEIDVFHTARDYGINVLFLGHHASETLGIKNLGKDISKHLSLETIFEDIPTNL